MWRHKKPKKNHTSDAPASPIHKKGQKNRLFIPPTPESLDHLSLQVAINDKGGELCQKSHLRWKIRGRKGRQRRVEPSNLAPIASFDSSPRVGRRETKLENLIKISYESMDLVSKWRTNSVKKHSKNGSRLSRRSIYTTGQLRCIWRRERERDFPASRRSPPVQNLVFLLIFSPVPSLPLPRSFSSMERGERRERERQLLIKHYDMVIIRLVCAEGAPEIPEEPKGQK